MIFVKIILTIKNFNILTYKSNHYSQSPSHKPEYYSFFGCIKSGFLPLTAPSLPFLFFVFKVLKASYKSCINKRFQLLHQRLCHFIFILLCRHEPCCSGNWYSCEVSSPRLLPVVNGTKSMCRCGVASSIWI